MSQSYRIDWFDGSVTQNRQAPTTSATIKAPRAQNSQDNEEGLKKAIGFRKLYDISQMEPPLLNLELESRPGFWLLFSSDLSDDFIVLIVKTLKTLYRTLDINDSYKLLQLLETKFLKSDFLDKLYNYVKKLPDVRFSQKSRNSQLWNDANSFFCDLVEFYKGIFNFYINRKKYLEQLMKVVEITEASAIGVTENHSESISPNFYEKISKLQKDLNKTLTDIDKPVKPAVETPPIETNVPQTSSASEAVGQDDGKTHFQDLSIIPNFKDCTDLESVNNIKPNIIDGAYASVEHYLDIQFKLLREDCYRTLKEGINHYRQHKNLNNCKDVNIRVYRKAFITDIKLAQNRVGYVVDLSRSPDLKVHERQKAFMHGALLILTPDNFERVLCATVLTGEANKQIIVEFSEMPGDVFSHEYLLVESDVYFEPYHKVLRVLQRAAPPIPMQKYIVHVDREIFPPAYLGVDTAYSLTDVRGRERRFRLLYPEEWPAHDDIGFDKSQMSAFRFALTREFVVIQGPPGTGKTHLGTRIAGALLRNITLRGSPLLVICCTNHALDQFLEGVLRYTTSVVRMGGQSRSPALDQYNFKHLAASKAYGRMYYAKRKELDLIYKEMMDLAIEMEIFSRSVLSLDNLVRHRGWTPCPRRLDNSSFLRWLLGTECGSMDYVTHNLQIIFSEHQAVLEIEKLKREIEQLKLTVNSLSSHSYAIIARSKEDRIRVLETTMAAFKTMKARIECFKRGEHIPPDRKDIDFWSLEPNKRWYYYYLAEKEMHSHILAKKTTLYEKYLAKTRELDELRDTMDCSKLGEARVVGMTTTMAAARHGLLKKLKSFVVIVEEAAEVLEAHIVAALTNECKHLILIGDHKQLRPNSAHYIIGKKYNLEVSLFERMVKNGVHSKCLTIQRRMRREIRDLLVPTIYEQLDCHPSVLVYPDVRGMNKNLYFFDHNNFEKIENNSSSYMNEFEAGWCVSLANYLVRQKYQPAEVTVLATYSAQVALIEKLRKKYELIRDVHVATVDNYQGEENRIVILSLVRSNREKNVGFLGTANRVCVALSRAKEGLYIFGNMSCLETSAMWRSMKRKLQAQDAIGSKFDLIIGEETLEASDTFPVAARLCRDIRARLTWRHVPIIALVGYMAVETMIRAFLQR